MNNRLIQFWNRNQTKLLSLALITTVILCYSQYERIKYMHSFDEKLIERAYFEAVSDLRVAHLHLSRLKYTEDSLSDPENKDNFATATDYVLDAFHTIEPVQSIAINVLRIDTAQLYTAIFRILHLSTEVNYYREHNQLTEGAFRAKTEEMKNKLQIIVQAWEDLYERSNGRIDYQLIKQEMKRMAEAEAQSRQSESQIPMPWIEHNQELAP